MELRQKYNRHTLDASSGLKEGGVELTKNLCGRCADRMRHRNIVQKTSEGVLWLGVCDNCKTFTHVATFEITPKRKE
jgi:hypothetical protein